MSDGTVLAHDHRRAVGGMLANYDFVTADTLGYLAPCLDQAPMDADYALAYVKENARTSEQQEAVLAMLRTKCDILWAMLDALPSEG